MLDGDRPAGDAAIATSIETIGDEVRFLALWRDIAARFARVGAGLRFELLNEPHDRMDAGRWNRLLAEALAVVRATGPDRGVIAGPARWNTVDALDTFEPPADSHLAATVHYYSPFRFTHQGASWLEGAEGWRGTTCIAWCYWDFATEFGAYDRARGAWHEPLRAALLG